MAGRIAYYGNIVTNGLILDLDASKKDSYPGTGTTWLDVSGRRTNASFQNGAFQVQDGSQSYVSFDGVDDFCSTSTPDLGGNFTIISWLRLNSGFGLLMNIISRGSGGDGTWYPAIYESKAQWYTGNGWRASTTTFVANRWYQVVFRLDNSTGSYRHSIFVNGQREYIGTDTYFGGNIGYIGTIGGGRYLNGRMSILQVYNIALSDTEVQQNYNALKGRYGL